MHPAKSVIFFTTASGAGYGLLALIALMDVTGRLPPHPALTWIGVSLALVLIIAGLLSSTLHLGHPERAWRALSQWRSSWLSREGVMAILTFGPAVLYGWSRLTPDMPWHPFLAVAAAVCAMVTVYCTAMIYASLKSIPAWSNPLTPLGYLTLSLSTGAVLLNAISFLYGLASDFLINITTFLILLALLVKLKYWWGMRKVAPRSTAESATGLGDLGKVHLLEAPHDGDNYLLTEMGFKVARRHAGQLRRIAILWGFLFPMLAVTFAGYSQGTPALLMIGISVITATVGVLAERWLFFAEAKHSVTLYYGEKSV